MRIGVDLGGTKIEALALDDRGRELARRRVPTPRGDYSGTVSAVARLVRALEAECGRSGTVGIGIPGALSRRSGLVKNANSVCLIGRPLDRDLSAALEREIRIENDANCFALSEAVDGAAAGAHVVFGAILGTGCGGGIVVGGKVLIGRNAIAGEWGHNPLPAPDADDLPLPPCYCGRSGCIETYLSGPAIEQDHGTGADAAEIESLALRGDVRARRVLDRHQRRLARSLASIVNVLDPDVIVLGGGLSNMPGLYEDLPRLVQPHVFSDRADLDIRPPVHGASSGVRGAAWLWPENPE